ncbi:MAG: hypothetical protein SVY53_10150 [Chloroflexota bacterium]|nr:hypothetical protein [Chloroflexota bacterium]
MQRQHELDKNKTMYLKGILLSLFTNKFDYKESNVAAIIVAKDLVMIEAR